MATTLQATAISVAQNMIKIAPLLQAARAAIIAQNAAYADLTPNTVWAHLPTFAWGVDGSVGTADNSPNTAHPISAGGLNRSSDELVALAAVFADFETFMEGGALSAVESPDPTPAVTIDQIVG